MITLRVAWLIFVCVVGVLTDAAAQSKAVRANFSIFANLQNELERSSGHWHFFDIQTRTGARFGDLVETRQDRPRREFI